MSSLGPALICGAALICTAACAPSAPARLSARPEVNVPTASAQAAPVPPSAEAARLGPAALAALPRGAAIYASLRWDALEKVLDARNAAPHDGPPDDFDEVLLGAPGMAGDILRVIHADPSRPIIGAVLAPSESAARGVVDTVVAEGRSIAFDRALYAARAQVILLRLVIPMQPGLISPMASFPDFGGALKQRSCESTGRCGDFAGNRPAWFSDGALGMRLAIYSDGKDLRVDAALPLFAKPDDPEPWQALAAFARMRGGPDPAHCSAFDERAASALCVDADAMAQLGTAFDYSRIVFALGGESIDPKLVRSLAEQGRKESQQNLALASPARRLLDDGTLAVRANGAQLTSVASWAPSELSRSRLEAEFREEQCASAEQTLPRLLDVFRDPNPTPAAAKQTIRMVQEAGWGGWPILFARSWPNVLDSDHELLLQIVPDLPPTTVCARMRDGRFEIESRP